MNSTSSEKVSAWQAASAILLIVLFVSTVLRAATQSITTDEAYTFQLFLQREFSRIFTARFETNNHVLYSILGWLSVHTFGISEISIRLPTIAAAVLFFISVFRMCSLLLGRSPLHLLSALIVAGNPYLLDVFTVGRGYGLGLAFLAAALCVVIEAETRSNMVRRDLLKVGILAGLSVASNLTFLFPVTGLFVSIAMMEARRYRGSPSLWPKIAEIGRSGFLPFAIFSTLILALPLRTAQSRDFYFGAATWRETIESTIDPVINHDPSRMAPIHWSAIYSINAWIFDHGQNGLIQGLFWLLAAAGVAGFLWPRTPNPGAPLPCLVLACTVAILTAGNVTIGLKLPLMRTTAALVFLLPLSLVSLIPLIRRPAWLLSPVYLYLAITFVRLWPGDYVADWIHDRPTRAFARMIESQRRASGAAKITVGGSWIFEPSLNFYRIKDGYSAWEPISRRDPSAASDYYVLSREDRGVVNSRKLSVLADDAVSQSLLAR